MKDSAIEASVEVVDLATQIAGGRSYFKKSVLERLRELGVRIAIDDFGTGYSSLSQLRLLPIDSLKIDRSFILGTPANHDDAVVVEAIVGLGRKLDLTLVAEGVETVEQLNFLRELGCHQCQGFLFSKPLPANEFEEVLKDGQRRIESQHARTLYGST